MKYAIVNNERVEAQKGMKGNCPVCNKPVIARCGEFKINHWAHTKSAHCDKWWEAETEWHRAWKDLFPKEWQEVIAYDEKTGEKHVADIKTDKGLVIEFQHSHIKPEEQTSRENFYKNMIWVVDGTRLINDYHRFYKGITRGPVKRLDQHPSILFIDNPETIFPKNWINRTVPVFFDFRGTYTFNDTTDQELRNILWCLLPLKLNWNFNELPIVITYDRYKVIELINNGKFDINYQLIIEIIQKDLGLPSPSYISQGL